MRQPSDESPSQRVRRVLTEHGHVFMNEHQHGETTYQWWRSPVARSRTFIVCIHEPDDVPHPWSEVFVGVSSGVNNEDQHLQALGQWAKSVNG